MPFARILPALIAAAVFLVLATAQRLLLIWLLWPRLAATLAECGEAVARGARVDLACVAAILLPVAIACSILPERAWASAAHRRLAGTCFGLALFSAVTFLTVDALQFLVHRARLASPMRQRLEVAWGQVAAGSDRAAVAAVTALACVVASLALGLALRSALRAAWKEVTPPMLRARDLVLVVAACVLALALMPRDLPFPGKPILGEISGASAPAIASRIWSRVDRLARPRRSPGAAGPITWRGPVVR